MKIDKDSFEILNKSTTSSLFRVGIKNNTVFIQERADDKIYGNILVYSENIDMAFDIVMQHKDAIDYLFFIDSTKSSLKIIAKPEENQLTIDEIFDRIKNTAEDFEQREEQIKLSKKIEECLENGKCGIFEAPTGTGKSIAYLIPAILYAKKNKQKIVISTNTINLQRQLLEKDLPILKSILNIKAKVAFGRSNYLCKRKLDALFEKGNIFLFSDDEYKKIKEFVQISSSGAKSEFFDSQNKINEHIWESIASTSLSCAHTKCPYYKNRCFYYKARASLDNADLIVANHHIVLSDAIMKDAKVLPEYNAIIFDEAHNLEKNATNYFTQTVSTSEIAKLLDRLYIKKKKKETGLLSNVSQTEDKEIAIKIVDKTKNVLIDILDFFQSVKQDEITISKNNLQKFASAINALTSAIFELFISLKKWKDNIDISAISQSLKENAEILETFLDMNTQNIKWIKKAQNYIHFNITPTSINTYLKENIYDNVRSVIFTSATISVNGNFDFFKRTLGIDEAHEFIAKNNFDYNTLSKLILIQDTPSPNSTNYTYFLTKIINGIAKAIKHNNLGVLILFTSYKMLNILHKETYNKLVEMDFRVLKQGEFDNFEILKEFKKNRSFLFATSSFWEGIDVKGNALSIVLITRLPFEVPGTPIENARYELMKKEGINAFFEYSLPKAVLKFRQGFGRLIRDKKDKGIIVVSDSRIIHKSYGKFFTNSLPKIKEEVIKTDAIKNSICNFFASN